MIRDPAIRDAEAEAEADTLAEMATQCTAPPELWDRHANEVLRLREVETAAYRLVEVINMAGLINLSNGVQLGQTSWYVKASDAMERLDCAMAGGRT